MAVKNTTQVLIDGKIITLGGYESPEYLQKVAAYLNQKISELSQSAGYNRLSVDTKHTLLALNIADDYFKSKKPGRYPRRGYGSQRPGNLRYEARSDCSGNPGRRSEKRAGRETNRAGTCARRDGRTAAAA